MGKLSHLIACCLFLAMGAPAQKLPDYFPRSWKTENGLPDNAVTAVVQTADGYLWLGTYGGLVRFDGARFTVFNSAATAGLQSDRVTSLYQDKAGALWIGHERGDLTRYREGRFEPLNAKQTGVRKKIAAMGADSAGEVWSLSEEGALRRVSDGFTCSLPNNDGQAEMAQDGQGRLWVSSGGQLATLDDGRLNLLTNAGNSNGVGYYVYGVCRGRDGRLWILSDGRVGRWDGHSIVEIRGTNFTNVSLVSMLETSSGALLVGTSNDGFYMLFPDGRELHFNQAGGFPNNWIRCMSEDREGTLWVGAGSDGLIALRPAKVASLNPPDHWLNRVVLSSATSPDGALWAATEGAGLYRLLDGAWTRYAEGAGVSNMFVWCVSADAQGRVWAGTWGGGMLMQRGDRFAPPPGLENVSVPMPAILHAPGGVTWIGSVSGLIRYENGAAKYFGESAGLKSPDVRAMALDGKGALWFGMLGGGLGCLENGKATQFLKADGLASDYIQCLHIGGDGAIWMGTYGSGVARYKDGRFSKITMAEGLPNNFICGIEADGKDNFWISSHGGIFRISQKALADCADGKAASINCLTYGKGDGMPSLECSGGLQPAACRLADGRICFPTSKGLVLVDPDDVKVNRLPPPVVIEDVVSGGRVLQWDRGGNAALKIPPGSQRFEFHFTGLSFVAPEKMQFQYRLEGWEKDWVDAPGDKRSAEYSYIAPGSYSFHVRACNSDGVWNEEGASLGIIVLPFFWQTLWFRILAMLAALAMVVGAVQFITRRRMRLKLEKIERQQALERERTRIAKDIHDHLGANLTRISLLSQSAHGELENPAQAAAQLERIYDTSRELTRSMDEIVWAVNPQHDTLDSLASYLGNFGLEYLVSIGIRCRLDVPLHLPHWPISAEVRHNVFLSFKEALHNIVKHSGAKEVSVLLATDDAGFHLSVRDNGKGFAPSSVVTRPGRGNGLHNMRQRLEAIGGRCEITSTPGEGAEVKFFIPVSAGLRKGRGENSGVIN